MQEGYWLRGYTVADFGVSDAMPKIPPVNPSFTAGRRPAKKNKTQHIRKIMAKDLGCIIPGLAPIIPDVRDTLNQQVSICHRIARGHPRISRWVMRRLKRIAYSIFGDLPKLQVDLSRDAYVKVLEARGDNEFEKAKMLKVWDEMERCGAQNGSCPEWNLRMMDTDGFLKEESYETFKAPRTICAPSDEHKVFFDPWIRAFEHQVLSMEKAVKFVPVDQRAKFVEERLGAPAAQFAAADGSAFESSHSPEIIRLCIYVLDLIMDHPLWSEIRKQIDRTAGVQKVEFNEWWFKIVGTLFSGKRWTALFNWILNVLASYFVASCSGAKIDGIFEGDDSIIVILSGKLDAKFYSLIGIDIKIEYFERLGDASFVGNIYSDSCKTVKDPWKILLNFGWSSSQYAASNRLTLSSLARAKAYSLLHELPSCPIITEFALLVIRETEFVSKKSIDVLKKKRANAYEKEKNKRIVEMMINPNEEFRKLLAQQCASVDMTTRLFFWERYGIPIGLQLRIEERLRETKSRSKNSLNLDLSFLREIFFFCPYRRLS